MENKEALETLKHQLVCAKEEDCINDYCGRCPHDIYDADFIEAITLAISALEKQEQVNAQSVNSTHTTHPNALESLNILESAKDEKGRVPMSLVKKAFRNILEQGRIGFR